MSRTSINSFDDITLSYVITAGAWCYLLQLLFSAVCLGAPSSSRGPWGAPLALTCALCICFLAAVWCYQQQLSSLLLVGCYQQQLFLCCCLGTTSNSSGPRGAPLGLVSFFPPISSLRFPPCCPIGGGESPFYRYTYRQCLQVLYL